MRFIELASRHVNFILFLLLAFVVAITVFTAVSAESVFAGPNPTGP